MDKLTYNSSMALYGSGGTVTLPDRFELVKDLKKMQKKFVEICTWMVQVLKNPHLENTI